MTKIAIFFANYGPYHLARLKALQQKCEDLGETLVGLELSRSGLVYNWQTDLDEFDGSIVSVLSDLEPEEVSLPFLIKKLFATLSEINPEVIAIAGYFRPAMLATLFWSLWHHKAIILLSATKESDFHRSYWKEKIKKFLVRRYKAALVGGEPHKRYLIKLGMSEESIFTGYNVVGNQNFHPTKLQELPEPLDKPFFLTINRFVAKKNIPFLITAYAKYREKTKETPWDLVLCGDGELRPQIEQQIAKLNLQSVVHLTGFLQQEEMLPYFAHAGCFVHASTTEQWGLVVNEAMAAGLPALVSNRCGCFEDLIVEGVNGFGFDPENSQQLTNLMLDISFDTFKCQKMGQAALEHIKKFSPDRFAQGLVKAIEYATTHS